MKQKSIAGFTALYGPSSATYKEILSGISSAKAIEFAINMINELGDSTEFHINQQRLLTFVTDTFSNEQRTFFLERLKFLQQGFHGDDESLQEQLK